MTAKYADKEALSGLAKVLVDSGKRIDERTEKVQTDIGSAVDRLLQTLSNLRTRAEASTAEMNGEVATIQSSGLNVAWYGPTREAAMTALEGFRVANAKQTEGVMAKINDVERIIKTNFATLLEEGGESFRKSGALSDEHLEGLSTASDTQRDLIEEADAQGVKAFSASSWGGSL